MRQLFRLLCIFVIVLASATRALSAVPDLSQPVSKPISLAANATQTLTIPLAMPGDLTLEISWPTGLLAVSAADKAGKTVIAVAAKPVSPVTLKYTVTPQDAKDGRELRVKLQAGPDPVGAEVKVRFVINQKYAPLTAKQAPNPQQLLTIRNAVIQKKRVMAQAANTACQQAIAKKVTAARAAWQATLRKGKQDHDADAVAFALQISRDPRELPQPQPNRPAPPQINVVVPIEAMDGDEIRVKGTGFAAGDKVYFRITDTNVVAAETTTFVSATELKAKIPLGAYESTEYITGSVYVQGTETYRKSPRRRLFYKPNLPIIRSIASEGTCNQDLTMFVTGISDALAGTITISVGDKTLTPPVLTWSENNGVTFRVPTVSESGTPGFTPFADPVTATVTVIWRGKTSPASTVRLNPELVLQELFLAFTDDAQVQLATPSNQQAAKVNTAATMGIRVYSPSDYHCDYYEMIERKTEANDNYDMYHVIHNSYGLQGYKGDDKFSVSYTSVKNRWRFSDIHLEYVRTPSGSNVGEASVKEKQIQDTALKFTIQWWTQVVTDSNSVFVSGNIEYFITIFLIGPKGMRYTS